MNSFACSGFLAPLKMPSVSVHWMAPCSGTLAATGWPSASSRRAVQPAARRLDPDLPVREDAEQVRDRVEARRGRLQALDGVHHRLELRRVDVVRVELAGRPPAALRALVQPDRAHVRPPVEPADLSGDLRVEEDVVGLSLLLGDLLRVVGEAEEAEALDQAVHVAVEHEAGHELAFGLEDVLVVVELRELRRVERLEQVRLFELHDVLGIRLDDVVGARAARSSRARACCRRRSTPCPGP